MNGHYVTSLSNFISVSMVTTSPQLALTNFTHKHLPSKIQSALVIHNEIKMDGIDDILGDIFFLPSKDAISYMFDALGLSAFL